MKRRVLHINEWGRVRADLNAREKNALQAKAEAWRIQNQLSAPPLWFEGTQGEWLRVRSYVGVLETESITLEIWPKLDGEDSSRESVMGNFLWLLEASQTEIRTADEAGLRSAPLEFFDVIALLFARRLLVELQEGLPVEYRGYADDLPLVRGRIHFARQATHNWDRSDQTACVWDEVSADTQLARLLKCACDYLMKRVRNARARAMLADCLTHLEEAASVTPREALRESIVFNRHTEHLRFSVSFAQRLLENAAYDMAAGTAPGLTFLLDMNAVFEHYVQAALRAHFGVAIATQQEVGTLLQLPRKAIAQRADFRWKAKGQLWLGDAKYKTPGALQNAAPDANDVRQITVYGEIEHRKRGTLPHLALLYPFVEGEFAIKETRTWNNAVLFLVPVHLYPLQHRLREVLPADLGI
jgi:5-methylcytosine-specific restriction enzyme subunit McrC